MSQQILNLHFPPVYGAHDFFIAPCNHKAYQWLNQWPQWGHYVSIISGPPGSGKTHLGHIWAQRAKALVLETHHFLEYEPRDLIHLAPAFFWDNPCFLGLEETVFHFYNCLIEHKKYGLIVHDQPPHLWPIVLPDLQSRLMSATHIPLSAPQDDLLDMMLHKLFLDYHINLPASAAAYILKRCSRSCRDLQNVVRRLVDHVHTTHQSLSLSTIRQVLGSEFQE